MEQKKLNCFYSIFGNRCKQKDCFYGKICIKTYLEIEKTQAVKCSHPQNNSFLLNWINLSLHCVILFVPQARCDQFLSWFWRTRGGCSYLRRCAGRFNCWSVCSDVICLPRRQTYLLFTSKYFDNLVLKFLADKLTLSQPGARGAGYSNYKTTFPTSYSP